ncbi:hypothetical protein JEQ12_009151 [Ovis aries]|uniref:Spermatogenesis-associated protein 6 N-terminal domain-containing protein n=1 Tax=Ovis aries TaxID=9940 RepID=A0A836D6K5_SHEEP|nr:hypothetical protein JEQ12_009151 [Ovis aries]
MREGVFLPDKHDVFLGVYLLNQYLETDCFPSMFPIMIQRSMRFEKVFENAIDPGAVADILEMWQELAYYEENTRDFLFPEPRLTPSHPGMCREVLMKTVEGFPGIAPKIEFSTRTAIRERVFLHRNRFFDNLPLSRKINELTVVEDSYQRLAHTLYKSETKASSVLRKLLEFSYSHVFVFVCLGQVYSEFLSSSLDSLGANVKDESPVKVYVGSIPTLSVVIVIAFYRIEYREVVNHLFLKSDWLVQEESISEVQNILDRPGYPLKKYRAHEQKYF